MLAINKHFRQDVCYKQVMFLEFTLKTENKKWIGGKEVSLAEEKSGFHFIIQLLNIIIVINNNNNNYYYCY